MSDDVGVLAESSDSASAVLNRVDDTAWAAAAFVRLAASGAFDDGELAPTEPEDLAAAETLAAVGLAARDGAKFALAPGLVQLARDGTLQPRVNGMVSSLRQMAMAVGILDSGAGEGWAAQDDETLLAQGRSSAMSGKMLAAYAVPSLDGLTDRFSEGGEFLDVGTGVGELAAAFAEAIVTAQVVGLDVLPRAIELARQTIDGKGLQERVDFRLQPVQELDDVGRFDLAWLPAPFIPQGVFAAGVARIREALKPGGWLVVGAGRFDGDALAIAVTNWKTLRAGGTPLAASDASDVLGRAGLVDFRALPTPPGAPALYAARNP